jgi:hypothetical protein
MQKSGTTNVYCVTTHAASPDRFVLYTRFMQNSNNKSPLPNPLPKDYPPALPFPLSLPLPLQLPNNLSLPLPLQNGSEKATPANA